MSYPGGKGASGVAQLIINQQPPHVHYVEPFLGSGAVLRAKRPAFWNTAIDLDPRPIGEFTASLGERTNCSIAVDDGVQWLADSSLRPDALVFCDPPYLMETRRTQRRLYKCEFDEDDHWRLLRVLRGLKCMVQITGYWSSLYAKRLEDWRLVKFQNCTRGGPVEECLWMNYPAPRALHDYRFLGANFRERERIGRKVSRWRSRIAKMPELERLALLSSTLAYIGDAIGPIAESADDCRPIPPILAMSARAGDRAESETAVLQ